MDPTFKLVFGTVVGLTLALIALNAAVSLLCAVPTGPQAELIDTSSSFAKLGLGSVFGLVGGRMVPAAAR